MASPSASRGEADVRRATVWAYLALLIAAWPTAAAEPARLTVGYSILDERLNTSWRGAVLGVRSPSWRHLALVAETSVHKTTALREFDLTAWGLSGGLSVSPFEGALVPEVHGRLGFHYSRSSQLGGPYEHSDTRRSAEVGATLRFETNGRVQPVLGFDIRWVRYVFESPAEKFPYWEKKYVFNAGIAIRLD